jgi:acyl-CoA reductase-like NAD-dependent aldehyde dehydrogenase
MINREDSAQTKARKSLAEAREFLKLPIEERRRILAEQAEQMAEHYEEESARRERELWQGGDIVEY